MIVRVLVTGGNGQLGKNLQKYAQTFSLNVVALGSSELDITDHRSIDEVFSRVKPDFVVNAAAYTAVDRAETDRDRAYLINETGPELLARACMKLDTPLFHISTDYVFDGLKNRPLSEIDEINPKSIYGCSKAAGEIAVRMNSDKHIILRTSWIFSAEGNNFLKTMLDLGRERGQVSVVADQFGGPTSADAIAKIVFRLINRNYLPWGIYHYSQSPSVSWYEFASRIFQEARSLGMFDAEVKIYPVTSDCFPTIAPRPKNSRLDCTKLSRLFPDLTSDGWLPDLKRILSEISG